MMRVLLAGIGLFMLSIGSVSGEETYSLSGIATFEEGDRIFISLYDRDAFRDFRKNPLPPEPYTVVIELGNEEKKAGRAGFRFEGIPRGTYALLAFRDQGVPGTERHPGKPASAYRMMDFSGSWDDVKFDLNRNMTGLEVRFEGKPR